MELPGPVESLQLPLIIVMTSDSEIGKTYTMDGTQQQPGIVPRAMEHLFRRVQQLSGSTSAGATEETRIDSKLFAPIFKFSMSHLGIYRRDSRTHCK